MRRHRWKVILLIIVFILGFTPVPVIAATGNTISVVGDNFIESVQYDFELLKDGEESGKGTLTKENNIISFHNLPNGNYTLTGIVTEGYEVTIQPESIQIRGRNRSETFNVTINELNGGDNGGDNGDDESGDEPGVLHYVALGNSLVTGSTSRGTTTSYAYGFYSYLKDYYSGIEVTMTSMAEDGNDSSDLLEKLEGEAFRAEVAKADIITLSIGGNNILGAGRDSNFSSIDEEIAEEGTARFEDEYPQIIGEIRSLNEDATIIVMTLYNPYNTKPISGYENDPALHDETEEYVGRINNMIKRVADDNYIIADVHNYFLENYANDGKMGDITYFYPHRWFRFSRDPHPNQKGQDEMLSIHINAYEEVLWLATMDTSPMAA